jgi:hypothetical protein
MNTSCTIPSISTCFHTNRTHPKRPIMRTTYQLAAQLGPRESQNKEEVWPNVIKSIIGWVRDRCPSEPPQEAWEGKEFGCEVPGHHVECVTIPTEGIWSLRLTHPDSPYVDQKAVPGRTWTTELTLKQGQDGTHKFGVRVFCTSQPYCVAEISLTRPKVIKYLADSFLLSTIRQIEEKPWYLNTDNDLDIFYKFITDPHRVLPVYLLTEADTDRLPGKIHKYVLDEYKLTRRTLGLAHVAVLPYDISFGWTKRVGKVWSAFQGATRTYRPGLNFETDSPFTDHPLAMAENMIFKRYKDLEGEEAFIAFLADSAHKESATRQVEWDGCLFFNDVRRRKSEIARSEAHNDAEWKAIYEDEIAALQDKIKEIEEERDEMIDLVTQSDAERDYYINENQNLHWQVESFRTRLAEKIGEDPDNSLEIPQNYEDLPEWVSRNMAGRLTLHPRAIRAVRDALYEDIELVYRSLLFLANEYRNKKLGYDDTKEAFDKQVTALKIECSPSIARERAGEEGDTYFVQYPFHTTNRRFLDRHIRKGKTKDDRYCLAIYFFWDDETQQVVVGWLPSHLDNRLT